MRNQKSRRPAVLGRERLAFSYATHAPPAGHIFERQIGPVTVVAPCPHDIDSVSSPAKSVSTETPLHVVSSFDQAVTQWMSTVGDPAGARATRARSS
jgi:hypothetical protein